MSWMKKPMAQKKKVVSPALVSAPLHDTIVKEYGASPASWAVSKVDSGRAVLNSCKQPYEVRLYDFSQPVRTVKPALLAVSGDVGVSARIAPYVDVEIRQKPATL